MPKRVASDDLVSAFLLALKQCIDARSLSTALPPRWLSHILVAVLAVTSALMTGVGARFVNFDYSSLSEVASLPSAFSQGGSGARDDVVVKPASVVTQFVNRPRQGLITHIVQEGETIAAVAEAYTVSISTILWANGLREDDPIQPGQKLVVLPVSGVLHEVKEGESIEDIARRYQSDVEAIVDFNQMTDPKQLVAGDRLVVPGGRMEPPTRMVASARSGERPNVEGAATEAKLVQPMRAFIYEVAPGDTLGSIAERHGISVKTILQANNLDDSELIRPGQELTILPVDGVQYTVKSGDTLSEVAESLQADAKEIIRANALSEPCNLQIGQKLIVPGGRFPSPVAIAAAPPNPQPAPVARPVATPPPSSAAPAAAQAPPDPKPAPAPAAAAQPTNNRGSTIVSLASKFLGYAYVWGGHSPSVGFDCSGLTWYVYRQAGVYLPNHDLWGQLQAGPRIKQADLLPGDLVFFENTYRRGLSHVGIYIGGGRFLHAADYGKGVRVDSLSDAYYGARYFGASRPW